MIDEGRIEGAYPELIELQDKLFREVNNGVETFCIRKMMDLNIDPEVVKFQAMEIQRLRALLQKYEWVSVSERLPEIGAEVIVTDKDGKVWAGLYYDYPDSTSREVLFHRWDDEMWNCYMPEVVAWMPLLEPYKGE